MRGSPGSSVPPPGCRVLEQSLPFDTRRFDDAVDWTGTASKQDKNNLSQTGCR